MSIILLLALGQAAANLPQSPLVGADHSHQWMQIAAADDDTIWVDKALDEDVEIDGGFYPLAIIRGVDEEDGEVLGFMDMKFGIDCQGFRLAAMDAWFQGQNPEEGDRETPEKVEFKSLDGFPEEIRDPLFQHVCGAGWRYLPSP